MRRREFITIVGGAAAGWPLVARAQQAAMPVIGILAVAPPEANAIRLHAIREGLRTVGYVEGQNVKIEYRLAEVHTGRLPALAAMQSLCTLRNHCRQWPRNTRYQADATP